MRRARIALGAVLLALTLPASVTADADAGAVSEAVLRAEAAHVPAHVRTWYYYGLVGVNAKVPPEVMARYADFVEDGDHGEFAARFKRAGGRYAAGYDDPAYIPYCDPPFVPPAGPCKWEYAKYVTAESAWLHGRDGSRIRRYVAGDKQYQEALNPLSPAAHRAWREFTRDVARRAPALDFLFSDDSGGPLLAGDRSPTSAHFYDFNEAGAEIAGDVAFRDGWIAYLRESALPLILNGSDPVTGQPAYGGAFLRQPFVRGAVHEGCLRDEHGPKTDRRDKWRNDVDSLLANTKLQRWAICFMLGTPTPENRVYALASWWLAYDPQWSVAAPIDAVPGQSALLPEYGIVPRFPLRTASDAVAALHSESGAYVREFAGCYEHRTFVGGCAAVVNPAPHAVPFPRLAGTYRRTLALTSADVLHGGVATWTPGVPPALEPGTAVVVAR